MSLFDGRQIAATRALANVGAKDLAESAGVTPRTIGRLEVDDAIAVAPKRRHGHVSKLTFDNRIASRARRARRRCPLDPAAGSAANVTRRQISGSRPPRPDQLLCHPACHRLSPELHHRLPSASRLSGVPPGSGVATQAR
jgi:hypothetical protein